MLVPMAFRVLEAIITRDPPEYLPEPKDPLQKLDPSAKQALEGKDKKWKESNRTIFYDNTQESQTMWTDHLRPLRQPISWTPWILQNPGTYSTKLLVASDAKNDLLVRWWVYQVSEKQNWLTTPTHLTQSSWHSKTTMAKGHSRYDWTTPQIQQLQCNQSVHRHVQSLHTCKTFTHRTQCRRIC